MKCNYHTHTIRCMHAVGTDEEYVRAAIAGGFDELGFSDHTPWYFRTDFVSRVRMKPEELLGYVQSLQSLRMTYRDQISLRIGLEIEWVPEFKSQYEMLRERGVEYFILGQHYLCNEEESGYSGSTCVDDNMVKLYADTVAEAVSTGLFRYVAHPDLYLRHRLKTYNKVCEDAALIISQAAREADLPLEYNLLGLSTQMSNRECGYPHPEFWKTISGRGNKTILGVDAHDPRMLMEEQLWNAGMRQLSSLGFTPEDHLTF